VKKSKLSTRYFVWIGAAIAVAVLLGYRKFYHHPDTSEMVRLRSRATSTSGQHRPFSQASSNDVSSIVWTRSGLKSPIDEEMEKADPNIDGWDTEALSAIVSRQLKRLQKYAEGIADANGEEPADLLAADFRCQTLRPGNLVEVLDDGRIKVRRSRAADDDHVPDDDSEEHQWHELTKPLNDFLSGLEMSGNVRVDLKLIGIEKSQQTITTRVLVGTNGTSGDDVLQRNAVWICRWESPAHVSDDLLLLSSIEISDYEEVVVSDRGRRLFADCTASAFAETDHYHGQVLRDVNFWASRVTRIEDMNFYGHHGLAVGDANGDGLEDLYVCDGGGLPNRLYLQNPDGTLRESSAAAGMDWLEHSRAALLVDLDNDGDQDLVVATVVIVLFAENDGNGHFELRGGHRAVDEAHSLCAADYDLDGDLDIYVCGYGTKAGGIGLRGLDASHPLPYHDANNGGRNALLDNRGKFRFVDVTEQVGLDQNNSRWSFAASWDDYDNDGDLDLYVANDFGRNNLYRNNGPATPGFTDVAPTAGVEDVAAGMSVVWGDYNRDGHMDVYVSNMFSAAGNRVAYQRRFARARSENAIADLRRMARGNTLFAGTTDGSFRDVSETAHVTMGRWAWSSNFADLNNDGWLDLVVANGLFTNHRADDL